MATNLIIGGGVSGLAAGLELSNNGSSSLLIESSNRIGGRVGSDYQDDLTLDRGFQVILESYPTLNKLIDLRELDLCRFKSGARIWNGKRYYNVYHPLFHPFGALSNLGFISPKDLISFVRLISYCLAPKTCRLNKLTTNNILERCGFSNLVLNGFFKPFFKGIMLDSQLNESALFFRQLFLLFIKSRVSIPKKGMQALPDLIAKKASMMEIRLNQKVCLIDSNFVVTENREKIYFDNIIIALAKPELERLCPKLSSKVIKEPRKRSLTLYFQIGDYDPINPTILILNGSETGLVNTVTFISRVRGSSKLLETQYCCVTLLTEKIADEEIHLFDSEPPITIINQLKKELSAMFGFAAVKGWKFLKSYWLDDCLPYFNNDSLDENRLTKLSDYELMLNQTISPKIYLAGDYLTSPSIDGALKSGLNAAKKILVNYGSS